jgi:hypothetical protein
MFTGSLENYMTDTQAIGESKVITNGLQARFARLVQWWSRIQPLHRGLWLLAGGRIVLALLILQNVLPLPAEMRFGWYLHHGGDHLISYGLARAILGGAPTSEVIGIGQSLVMIPWIVLLKPSDYFDIVVPLVLINGFLLAGLSVIVVGLLAKYTTGNDRVSLWSGALWAAAPLFAYYGFFWHHAEETLRGSNVPKIGWLNGLSDPPATFFVLLAAMMIAQPLAKAEKPSVRRMFFFGMALGLAVIFRIHIAFIVAFLLLFALVVYGWKPLIITAVGGLIAYIPQAWYNTMMFGLPITTGYLSVYRFDPEHPNGRDLETVLETLPFHPKNIVELGQNFIGNRPWLLLPLLILVTVLVVATVAVWKRRGWREAALLIGTPVAYLIPMSAAWPFREDIIRFSIPVIPFILIVGIYVARLVWEAVAKRKHSTAVSAA